MYGYAAKYAPSSVIEARIDALVVCLLNFITIAFLFILQSSTYCPASSFLNLCFRLTLVKRVGSLNNFMWPNSDLCYIVETLLYCFITNFIFNLQYYNQISFLCTVGHKYAFTASTCAATNSKTSCYNCYWFVRWVQCHSCDVWLVSFLSLIFSIMLHRPSLEYIGPWSLLSLCEGRAVINASESGATFPLKRRDTMLDYILTLMGRDENEGFAESSLELLHTQVW